LNLTQIFVLYLHLEMVYRVELPAAALTITPNLPTWLSLLGSSGSSRSVCPFFIQLKRRPPVSQPRVESLPSWLPQGLPQTQTTAATMQHQHLDVVVQQAADAHTCKHNTRRGEKSMYRRHRMAKAVNEKEVG
jgi:hypothetical protein